MTEVFDEVVPSLPPLRRRALEVALLLAEPGAQPPDAHAIGLALLDVLRVLGERAPLVVALDDPQWLDPSSAAVLQIALRRLREEPVGVLASARDAPEAGLDLARAFPGERLTRLIPSPLGPSELRALLKAQLSLELSRSELARVLDTYRRELRQHGIASEIARRQTEHASGLGRVRWVVERAFAWLHHVKRLLVRYDRRHEIHDAFLALGCCLVCFRRLSRSLDSN